MASTIQINRIVFIIKGGGYCRLTVRGRFVVLIGEKKLMGPQILNILIQWARDWEHLLLSPFSCNNALHVTSGPAIFLSYLIFQEIFYLFLQININGISPVPSWHLMHPTLHCFRLRMPWGFNTWWTSPSFHADVATKNSWVGFNVLYLYLNTLLSLS